MFFSDLLKLIKIYEYNNFYKYNFAFLFFTNDHYYRNNKSKGKEKPGPYN
jgi:hypothetical protein